MFKSLRIPFAFLVTGICWVFFSDQVITFLSKQERSFRQDPYGHINSIAFVVITALVLYFQIKRLRNRLAGSEEEYKRLFESNPNPMWIYNIETLRFIKVNDAAIGKYQFSRNMFLKMTINDIRCVDEDANLHDYFKAKVMGSKRTQFGGVWKHRKGTGEVFSVSVNAHQVLFKNQNCNLVMATDITELLEKEKKLESAYLKTKTTVDELVELAWSNSHEIRKPLCSIISLITLLKQTTDEQEKEEFLELLEACSTELDIALKENNEKVKKMGTKKDN